MCTDKKAQIEMVKIEMRNILDSVYCKNCPNEKLCFSCYIPAWKESCDKEAEKYFVKKQMVEAITNILTKEFCQKCICPNVCDDGFCYIQRMKELCPKAVDEHFAQQSD